jgi:hypothetical protein
MSEVSVERLTKLVDKALEDEEYANRLFNDPDAIARENNLSDAEIAVVKQMGREQFDTARADAKAKEADQELSDDDLEAVAGGRGSFSIGGRASSMIVGRSILGASGKSYKNLTNAGCGCCPWAGNANLGSTHSLPM